MTAITLLSSGGLTIFGTLLGVALGLFGERYLRGRGNLRCSLVRRELRWSRRDIGYLDPEARSVDQVEDFEEYAVDVTYELSFFNEKEVDHGLSSINVVFLANGDEARVGSSNWQEGLKPVNLAARRWSDTTVTGRIEGPSCRFVRDYKTIEVWGVFPDHSPFKQTIVRTVGASPGQHESRPWWRRVFGG
jgi:hypothetical protein